MNILLVSDCLNSDYIIFNVLHTLSIKLYTLLLIPSANESVWITRNFKFSCLENVSSSHYQETMFFLFFFNSN